MTVTVDPPPVVIGETEASGFIAEARIEVLRVEESAASAAEEGGDTPAAGGGAPAVLAGDLGPAKVDVPDGTVGGSEAVIRGGRGGAHGYSWKGRWSG